MFTSDENCLNWCKKYIWFNQNDIEYSWEQEIDNKELITIFDIGHNDGDFTRKTFQILGNRIKIHAFEPNLQIKSMYEKNPIVEIHKIAISDKDSKGILYVPTKLKQQNSSSHLSSLFHRPIFDSFKDAYIQELEVPIMSLDSFCLKHNINFINYLKIDVEGFEFEVFKGSQNLLKNKKIICGQFEVGSIIEEKNSYALTDIIKFLKNFEYECYLGDIVNLNLLKVENCTKLLKERSSDNWENIIFINKDILNVF